MNEISSVIGRRIKNLRLSKKMSQEKLAELSGLHSTYIGQIERGEKSPTIDSVYKISKGLSVSLVEIFKNISIDSQNDEYANKIYDIMVSLSDEKQKGMYNIIKEILAF